ncbi:unnamed protein product [Mytilus edulis]|uniref:Tetraspanin n=1 Tax=Mytilus edulis TaxID=6550 RepID=A0A8S3UV33_MYTED|nr:unnamed protein product [Mytilus edulis]
MAKIDRSRMTISANIILTVSLITRTLTFGFIFISIYIKVKDDILDEEVIKVVDMEVIAGMPLGSTVRSIIFSLIGVFVLELITGIFGMCGALGRKKRLLAVAVVLSSFLICVYIIYIVLLSVIYHKKTDLYYTLLNYTTAYQYTLYGYQHISYWNRVKTFPEFMQKLGCQNTNPERYHCWSLYVQELGSYLEIYLGIIVTCIICQICSIVAAEYIFRKLEFKEKKTSISENKYFLLLSLNHGIFRSWIISIKQKWNRSKIIFASVMLKISSLVAGLGLLVLGLTLIGDVFITDGSLKHIFYKIHCSIDCYWNVYFIGGSSWFSWILEKFERFLITSSVLSLALHIPRLITVVLWIVFIAEINNGMKFQLWLQQLGYFYGGNGNRITGHWNNMIMTLQCCGVNYYSETHTTQGIKFCCKNAHPRILDNEDPNTNSYYGLFDYFGGCGGYKTDTCADVIIFKTKMFVGWFLAIVLLQIVLEIIGILFANKEYSDKMTTKTTDKSTGEEMYTKSVIFRTVFRGIKSFFSSNWKRSKISLGCLICLGTIFICNLVLLCLAINIRYDKVFGNSDIRDIFSRINITNHTFSRAINIFFIVTVAFSSVSIAVVILSIVFMILSKWKSVLHFVVSSELENELRTLFAECCGVGSLIESSFTSTDWYTSSDRSGHRIPVQCCKSQSDVFPYADRYDSNCTNSMLDGYFNTQSCDDAVEKRLKTYSIIFFVFMSLNILAEMCCVIMIVYDGLRLKKDSKKVHLDVKAVDNTKEIKIEIEKHILEPSMENEALKSRKRKRKKSKSGKTSKTNKSKTRESIEFQKKENTIIQEQSVNTNELQPIKSMEFEDNEKVNGDSKQIDKISGTNDAEEVDTFAKYNSTESDTHIKDPTETTDL